MNFHIEFNYAIGDSVMISPYEDERLFQASIIGYDLEIRKEQIKKFYIVQCGSKNGLVIIENEIKGKCN